MKTVLAGDLGGTKSRFALVTADYRVHGARQIATAREREPFLQSMYAAFAELLAELPAEVDRPCAIGLGSAGVVPKGGRVITRAPNLPLDGHPLADELERRFGLPTTVLNDGRASALGEYHRGNARGSDPLLCLFFGTGIGIGLVVDGRIYEGADNAAGEIGHTVHVPGGRPCSCGRLGHFEAYCGGRPMTERARAELGPPPSGTAWTAHQLRAQGSAVARRILDEALVAAGAMVANACTLLNPRAVVLGGGVLAGWPELGEHIETYVRESCSSSVTGQLQFHRSVGGSDAILWGAASATGKL